ncbi:hypothetical protein D3C86_1496890 [compost metagenome]
MPFGKSRGLITIRFFGDHMIGGGGGVGEHHRHLPLGEKAVGFRPARRDGENALPELCPCFRGLVTVDRFYPQQQAEPRRGGARVLNGDLLRGVAFHQLFQARRWVLHRLRVIDDGKMPVVVRHENIVPVTARHLGGRRIDAADIKKTGLFRLGNKIGVETNDHIRPGPCAFKLQTVKKRHTIRNTDEIDRATADLLEGFFYLGTGTPFGNEALIGIDCQFLLVLRGGKTGQEQRSGNKGIQEKTTAHGYLLKTKREIAACLEAV